MPATNLTCQKWDAASVAEALGGNSAGSGDGWSRAPCPAHGGINPNLAIRDGRRGSLIIKCWSHSCASAEILAAIDERLGTNFSGLDLVRALGPLPAHLNKNVGAGSGDAGAGSSAELTTGVNARQPEPAIAATSAPIKAGTMAAWTGSATTAGWSGTATPTRGRATAANQNHELTPVEVREWLRKTWQKTETADPGSLVHRFLTETRGLALPTVPRTLRYHPKLCHKPTGTSWPAMVALVVDYAGKPVAVHRTWLNSFTADKAISGEEGRMSYGPCKGGAVRLAGKEDSTQLLVGEGVETVLAAAELAAVGPEIAVWSALSTSGLVTLVVPARFKRVVIAADNDPSGGGERAANVLARKLRKRGIEVDVRMPKPLPEREREGKGTDWNDVLLARRGVTQRRTDNRVGGSSQW